METERFQRLDSKTEEKSQMKFASRATSESFAAKKELAGTGIGDAANTLCYEAFQDPQYGFSQPHRYANKEETR